MIKEVFIKRNIPIVFCGEKVYKQYKDIIPSEFPWFLIKQSLSECTVGVPWNTENVFTKLNKYLWEDTKYDDVQWVNMDVPF